MFLSGGIECLKRIFFPPFALLCLGIGASCTDGRTESLDRARLEALLSSYYERSHQQGQPQIRSPHNVAAADLDGDQVDELLVYLRSENFCGSGGCMLLILAPREIPSAPLLR